MKIPIVISKDFTFDCAHMLSKHSGDCASLHGHTYRLSVKVTGYLTEDKGSSSEGMVIDYGTLSSIVKQVVISKFDHAFIYDVGCSLSCTISELLKARNLRVLELPCRSTAENLCIYIATLIRKSLPKGIKLVEVVIWETPNSSATYSEEVDINKSCSKGE